MEKLVPKILSKQKWITNRAWSEFRSKCIIGDIMHCFTGLRTKNAQKICDAKVVEIEYWENHLIPEFNKKYVRSPLSQYAWAEFSLIDGFDNYNDFVKYFKQKLYNHGILCYNFRIIEV